VGGGIKCWNIQSLEELIQQAIDHGVRLIACQMSMEIMGIRQEELIDGIELGGVATFVSIRTFSDLADDDAPNAFEDSHVIQSGTSVPIERRPITLALVALETSQHFK
jgi:hypothetical protein